MTAAAPAPARAPRHEGDMFELSNLRCRSPSGVPTSTWFVLHALYDGVVRGEGVTRCRVRLQAGAGLEFVSSRDLEASVGQPLAGPPQLACVRAARVCAPLPRVCAVLVASALLFVYGTDLH